MFNSSNGYSLSDIAAASRNNNNGGWNDGGSWWIILLFLFCFAGWGNGGFYGYGGGSGSGAADNYVLASDFASLERIITGGFERMESGTDTVRAGLCDGFYTEARLVDGVNQNLNTGFYNTLNAINTNGYESRLATQGVQNQIAQCCCDMNSTMMANANALQTSLMQAEYNEQARNCATNALISNSTRDIIDGQNANTKAILDFLVQDKISTLTAENQSLKFAASQAAQNNYLISTLLPTPVPAYQVPNPFSSYGYNGGCQCG